MKVIRYISLWIFIFYATSTFAQNALTDTTVSFKVYGACEGRCKARIESAVQGKGIQSDVWNVDSKMLTVVYDPSKTSLEKIQTHILDTGHDLDDKKAKEEVYNTLPSCC